MLIALAIVLVAAGGWMQYRAQTDRTVVLDVPVVLDRGASSLHTFTVDTTTSYWVEIDCQRRIPFEKLQSALTDRLAVDYTITSEDRTVAQHVASIRFYGGPTVGRVLCEFDARRGHAYTIVLESTRSLPDLSPTQPKLKVEADPIKGKDAFLLIPLSFLGALLCLIPIARRGVSRLFRRRDKPSNQAMQLTAPRSVSPLRVAITFSLQRRALSGAVADLVFR